MRVVVAPLRSFPSGERRIVEVGGRSIGVFRQSFMGALAPGVRSYGVELSPGGSLGGDVRWAAALHWSLDAAWELMREDHPRSQRKPSEYVDEHVWFTTQPVEEPEDPQHLVHAIEQARLSGRLLFATDYPHWDFDSPKQALPRALGPELRRAIPCENALALYGLPSERRATQ